MSNHLAIATVTETLARLLRGPVGADVQDAEVTPGRPDVDPGEDPSPEVRIYLYRVEPNTHWRNEDLPTRQSNGTLSQRPQLALTLNYLFTFLGSETELVPQRLLASTTRALHTRPNLPRPAIRRTIELAVDADPNHYLADADLAEQPEIVRFTPLSLTLDELSNLWSVFFQSSYQLSVAYEAAVVLISPDEAPTRALPVLEPRIYTVTLRQPRIDRVVSSTGPREPVTAGDEVRIEGQQLRGEITRVRVGPSVVLPANAATGETAIVLTLPAGLLAGLLGVRVQHAMLLGEPPEERVTAESNLAPLILHPRFRETNAGFDVFAANVVVDADGFATGEVVGTVEPDIARTQKVSVTLNEIAPAAGPPHAYTFDAPSRDEDLAETTDTLRVPFAGVVAGDYLVRVRVDGAESALVVDDDENSPTFRQYIAPRVEIQ